MECGMSLFLDQLWIWIVLTFIVGGCSFSWYLNNPQKRTLLLAGLLPLLTLTLGLTLYYGVDTKRKSIKRTVDALIAAVEKDDLETVCQLISPKAQETLQLAKGQMGLVSISRAKYRDLQIEVNDATSPPTAKVRFSAFFYWKTKAPIDGFMLEKPVPENARFELELVNTKSQAWLVTDKCRYFLPNFP